MAGIIYKEGSRGDMVKKIQRAVGCYPDGIWGRLTTEALKAYQRKAGLKDDGIAGPATLAYMGIQQVTQSVTQKPAAQSIQHGKVLLKRSKRRIDYIAIHCTATPEGMAKTVDQIKQEHQKQGWATIGYHYVIEIDGSVHIGRDVDISGAHVDGYNANSIGVVYVGGLENKPNTPYALLKTKDTRTQEQKAELLSLLMDLRRLYPNAKIQGHRDFPKVKKGCPSFDAKNEYSKI